MTRKEQRDRAIAQTIDEIRAIMARETSVATLEEAKTALIALAARGDLFCFEDYPLPRDGSRERTYLIHQDPDGSHALYVNAGMPDQSYRPHDHGGSWAIVTAVHGRERHRLYMADESSGEAPIVFKGEIDLEPGGAVSLLPDGIHAIEALDGEPLLHLHLYARSFAQQDTRREYDLETGAVRAFKLEDLGFIEDTR